MHSREIRLSSSNNAEQIPKTIKSGDISRPWSRATVGSTHLVIWMKPQEAAACRGVQPSLSPLLMSLPFSTRNWTISAFSSIQACKKTGRNTMRYCMDVSAQQRGSLTHFTLVYSQRQKSRRFQNLLVSTKAPGPKNNDYCVYLEGLFTKWNAKSPQVLSKTVVSWHEWNSDSVQQLLLRPSQAKISTWSNAGRKTNLWGFHGIVFFLDSYKLKNNLKTKSTRP